MLTFSGELDLARAGGLRKAIDEALAAGEPPRLALDLGDVAFCDSYGLSVLVYAAKKVRERDGTVRLSRVSPQVRMLIERCGLEPLLALPGHSRQSDPSRNEPVPEVERRRSAGSRPGGLSRGAWGDDLPPGN